MDPTGPNIDFELIWKDAHNELTEAEEVELGNWRTSDPRHEAYYQKAISHLRGGAGGPDINSSEAWLTLLERIDRPRRPLVPWKVVSGIAASVLLVATIGFLVVNEGPATVPESAAPTISPGTDKARLTIDNGQQYTLAKGSKINIDVPDVEIQSDGSTLTYSSKSTTTAPVTLNTLEVPRGGEFFLVFSDGTKAWVNAASRLQYPSSFAKDVREVELTGEAYFEVVSNPEKPFIVRSAGHAVTVLGTSFNVSAYEDDPTIVTTLVEGSVTVAHEAYGLRQNIAANEQTILVKKERSLTFNEVDPWQYVAWKENRFYFQNRPLKDIMTILSRWYDVDVFFDNTTASEIRFTGGFRRYQEFKKVEELLEKTDEIDMTVKGRTIVIR